MDCLIDLTPANREAYREISSRLLDRIRECQKRTTFGRTVLELDHKNGDIDLIEFGATNLTRAKDLIAAK